MLGYETEEKEISVPRMISLPEKVVQVASGAKHCIALTGMVKV